MPPGSSDPAELIRPGREILGMAAVLLPFRQGRIDWEGFGALLERTAAAGLVPAVNMDTGYVDLLAPEARSQVLACTRVTLGGDGFVAGAFVGDAPGDALDLDAYDRAVAAIAAHGGTPVVFPSYGLTALPGTEVVAAHEHLGSRCDALIAFELGEMFVPFGRIYDLDTYAALMAIPQCTGAKHSSLSRELEWERLRLRDALRPDFRVYTGNDLAIDMVMYGSDYLLGLAAFAPDAFAARDEAWRRRDNSFFERNDALQALGSFAFRDPVPGYKHNAAQTLALRGWIASDEPHPAARRRPDSDREVLAALVSRLHP